MATSIDARPESAPDPETDKLGPLGAKGSALHDPVELRAELMRAFAGAVHDAQQAAAAVDHGATKAVHEARKALRRARSVLAMLGGALPKSERRAIDTALQEARRALSTARDHAVAPDTLGELDLGEEDRATARRVLDNAAGALPATAELAQLVGNAAARAAAQLDALEAALPRRVAWETVVEGIEDVYDEARRARRASKRSRAAFHTWRRRSKELIYQLSLLTEHAGPRLAAIHAELAGVTDTLGPAVDLIMLREFVTTYDHGLEPAHVQHLLARIDGRLADLIKEARRGGRDSFRQKPKKLGKRLTKAVLRDLTPADHARGGD